MAITQRRYASGIVDRQKADSLGGQFAKRRRRKHNRVIHRRVILNKLMQAFQSPGSPALHLDWLDLAAKRDHEINLRLGILRLAFPPVRFISAKRRRKFLRNKLLRKRAVVYAEKVRLANRLIHRPSRKKLVEPDITGKRFYARSYIEIERQGGGGSGRFILNGILNQRSQDILAANNWNVVQYAVLIYMLAQVNDMLPGELIHVISDAHIYDRHVDIIREMIERPQYPAPKFALNPEIKNFYDFTLDDITITDYKKNPQIKNIPIAV